MGHVNNVNADAMLRFTETVKKEPSQAHKRKSVTGRWIFEDGRPQFVAELEYPSGSVELTCEMPPFAGGWGTSPDPQQYCLFGTAACFAATLMAIATAEGVTLSRLKVTAESGLDLHKQLGLGGDIIVEGVQLRVKVEGAPRDVLERLVEQAEHRCPGTECITRAIPLEIELVTRGD